MLRKKEPCYDLLVSSYHSEWPANKEFITEISHRFDINTFLSALKNLKFYIMNYSHTHKCVRRPSLFGSYYVSYSDEFNSLNKDINELLDTTELSYYYSQFITCMKTSANILCQYVKDNPIQASLFFLAGFSIASAYAVSTPDHETPNSKLTALLTDLEKSGVSSKNITNLSKECFDKERGLNDGKVCNIDNKKYYMKDISVNNAFTLGNNPLVSIHQNKIVDLIKIKTPALHIFNERIRNKNYYFLSTEEVAHFQPASDIPENRLKELLSYKNNLAKLAVANTLIGDMHEDNFGFSGNELVIIDFDMRLNPEDSGETSDEKFMLYFAYGVDQLQFILGRYAALSKKDVKQMLDIYKDLHQSRFPKVSTSLDIDTETYKKLIEYYIVMCENVLNILNDSIQAAKLKSEYTHYSFGRNIYINYFFSEYGKFIFEQLQNKLVKPDKNTKPGL